MLNGEKVRLRALEAEDLAHCLKWLNDWNVVRTLSAVWYPISREAERAWLERRVLDDDPTRKSFVIESHSGQYLGNCDLELIDHRDRKARVGIVIGLPEYWDKGFGREALKLLAQYAFDFLNLRKLYRKPMPSTPAPSSATRRSASSRRASSAGSSSARANTTTSSAWAYSKKN